MWEELVILEYDVDAWHLKVSFLPKIFAAIGEAFDDLDVVGVVLSIRPTGDVLSIWNGSRENPTQRQRIRFPLAFQQVFFSLNNIGFIYSEKLKEIWHLDPNSTIEYKAHSKSMKDGSTYRNGSTVLLS